MYFAGRMGKGVKGRSGDFELRVNPCNPWLIR